LLALVKKFGKSNWDLIYNKMADWPKKQILERYVALSKDKKLKKGGES